MKYLKHLDKGTIYNWNEYLAEHPRIELHPEGAAWAQVAG